MKKSQSFTINHLTKQQKYYGYFATALGAFFLAYIFASIFAPVSTSSAQSSTDLNMSVAKESAALSLTTSGTINLTVTDPGSGEIVSGVDSLSLTSLAADGYQLYISMDNNHEHGNRLYLGGDESSGYFSPNHDSSGIDIAFGSETTLSTNSWGFTTDPTKHENKQYSAVPILGNGIMIDSQDKSGTYNKSVYYAVSANQNMSAGTYTGKVIYTIISNETADNYSIPSVSPASGSEGSIVEISLPLKTKVEDISDLGTINATIDEMDCLDQSYSITDTTATVNCTMPELSTTGVKSVAVSVQKYGNDFTNTKGFTYNTPSITYLTYMQDMSSNICSSTPEGTTTRLMDKRGRGENGKASDNTYGIVRAKDGNCWMTEDIDLTGTVYSADTDMGIDQYTISAAGTYEGHTYYTWCNAKASTMCNEEANSICPRMWQLPVSASDTSINKSVTKLFDVYNVKTPSDLMGATSDAYILGFNYAAGYISNGLAYYNQQGRWWLNNQVGDSAYEYGFDVGGGVFNNAYYFKGVGNVVRCVSRD